MQRTHVFYQIISELLEFLTNLVPGCKEFYVIQFLDISYVRAHFYYLTRNYK